jgi:hypothetical protein
VEAVEDDYGVDDEDGMIGGGDGHVDVAPFAGNAVVVKDALCPFDAFQLDAFCSNVPKVTLLHTREQCNELFQQAYTSALEIVNT